MEAFVSRLRAWGVEASTQVVAYDGSHGAFAARLWWLMRWVGHDRVAVMDGGWSAWGALGLPTTDTITTRAASRFEPRVREELVMDAGGVMAARAQSDWRVLDARGSDRFRGENETIDPVAGRVPGAVSAPFLDNVDSSGTFRSVDALHAMYRDRLAGVDPARTVVYCGSGVTAAHDLLAMAHAGLDGARLYPGSWSEWITDPDRPVARGPVEP